MSVLNLLGFYTDAIDNAFEKCENALNKVLLKAEIDTLEKRLKTCIKDWLDWNAPSDSIIELMFSITSDIISDEYPELKTDSYVNGYDSHFFVYDNNIFGELQSVGIGADKIKKLFSLDGFSSMDNSYLKEIASNEYLFEDIVASFEAGNDYTWYESVEELGAENGDNGCREDDDTDEMFGNFLIQAYKDGNSNMIYAVMPDGVVIELPLVNPS